MTILDQSLCLLQGVSAQAEVRLHKMGVLTCKQLAEDADRYFSAAHAERIRDSYGEWLVASKRGLVDWIVTHLPLGHRVRVLKQFWNDAMFYDIETDGITASSCITCISTFRAGHLSSFWRRHNLRDFLDEWANAKILVSFNGKRFDTPMVCRNFGLTTIPAQVDLMDEAGYYGYRGGLKAVERMFGFRRKCDGCDNGLGAVALWKEYIEHNSERSLEKLLAYNQDDVMSLVAIAKELIKRSVENTSFFDI